MVWDMAHLVLVQRRRRRADKLEQVGGMLDRRADGGHHISHCALTHHAVWWAVEESPRGRKAG